MKKYLLCWLLLTALTGCGQLGPLYLPDAAVPPVYVPPEPESKPAKLETKTPTNNTPSKPEQTK